RARFIKQRFKNYEPHMTLHDRTLAMVFEKASTRTRVSFEAGMYQMGGSVIHLTTNDSQLGRAEPIEDTARVISRMVDLVMIRTFSSSHVGRAEPIGDTARVLSRMVDLVMIRTFGQVRIDLFAKYSRVPVFNGLTNEYHPCQILADIFTYNEFRGSIAGKTVAWIGDGNKMAYTWLQAAKLLGFKLHFSSPQGYSLDPELIGDAGDALSAVEGTHAACG